MKRGIAFFDFDGTITSKDTLLEFIKFSKGRFLFTLGFILNSPYLIGMKLKLITNQAAKEKVLQFFFRNTTMDDFEKNCSLFAAAILPGLLRPKAMDEIKRLKKEGFLIVIVSASPENWIKHWSHIAGAELIASQLEIKEGRVTGKILGKNCHGEEKVRRIIERYTLPDYDKIYAYGDSSGDLAMLKLANQPYYKPFI